MKQTTRTLVLGLLVFAASAALWGQSFQPGQIVEVFAYGNWGTVGKVQRVDASGVLVLYRAEDGSYNERTGFTRYFAAKDVRLQGSVAAGATGGAGASGGSSAQAAPTPGSAFKVGDRVEGWNIAWYKGTVAKVGVGTYAGYYLIKHDEFSQDAYYKESNVRRLGAAPPSSPPSSLAVPSAGLTLPPLSPPGGTGLKAGTYGCGVYLSGRYTPTQRITLEGGRYTTTHGGGGRYTFDAASGQVQFQGGALADQVGRYEPANNGIIRLTQRKDLGESEYTQKWRSQVCSPR